MKVNYVVIEREYGCGGSEIAEKLAKRCGFACYGPEILTVAAENLGISTEIAQQYEEKATNSFLYSMFVMAQAQSGSTDVLPMESKLFVEQYNTVKGLAGQGKAIFVGHCAGEALRDQEGLLTVFIRAGEDFKKQRAVQVYGVPEKDAEAVCKRINKRRANYYSFNTSKKWDNAGNYDVVLDSSKIGIDACVELLAAIIESGE